MLQREVYERRRQEGRILAPLAEMTELADIFPHDPAIRLAVGTGAGDSSRSGPGPLPRNTCG